MFGRLLYVTLASIALGTISGVVQADAAKLVVREVSGEVVIETAGRSETARVGLAFRPPAEVRTGVSATVVLADSETSIRISANSIVAIPASAQPSSMVDRILQRAGSVLYDVNSRKGRPFAVETPLLTSVVKGTLFSIDAQPGATTVALLEGSLEVTGSGVEAPVLLSPGEAAHRKDGERRIGVEKRNVARVPSPASRASTVQPAGLPDALAASPGQSWATEDLAQITAAIGLAPPAEAPSVLPPGPSPSAPGSSLPPQTSDPVPGEPPPSSPGSSEQPAPSPAPGTTPPVVTAPPVASPPVAGAPEGTGSSKGARKGRARGHEQGHGKGNDERDSEGDETP